MNAFFMRCLGVSLLFFAAAGASGCAWFQSHPKVTTDLGDLTKCVVGELAKDAALGDTLIAIGFDVGVTCGPAALAVLEDALAQPATQKLGSKGSFVLAMRKQNVR